MIVDPSTGLPIDEGSGGPQSALGLYGTSVGQGAGLQTPLYYDAMNSIPPATTMVAWNMRRVQNTILGNKNSATRGKVSNAGGIRQTFSPFRFNSLADVGNIDPNFIPRGATKPVMPARPPGKFSRASAARKRRKASKVLSNLGDKPNQAGWSKIGDLIDQDYSPRTRSGYTPFNVLATTGNSIYARTAGGKELLDGQRAFAPGALGSVATMSTVMAGSASSTQMTNMASASMRFAGGANYGAWQTGVSTGLRNTSGLGAGLDRGTALAYGHGNIRFASSKVTGRAAGYYAGAQAARMGTTGSGAWALARTGGVDNFFGKGTIEGATKYASSSKFALARVAGSRGASLGLRAAGPVGTALLVRDLAMFGGKMTGRGLRLGIQGIKSAQGDLTKPGPFGMGYQDNSVAATSRQRGVMAISNSRLNARSALGQEASMMHAAFG